MQMRNAVVASMKMLHPVKNVSLRTAVMVEEIQANFLSAPKSGHKYLPLDHSLHRGWISVHVVGQIDAQQCHGR